MTQKEQFVIVNDVGKAFSIILSDYYGKFRRDKTNLQFESLFWHLKTHEYANVNKKTLFIETSLFEKNVQYRRIFEKIPIAWRVILKTVLPLSKRPVVAIETHTMCGNLFLFLEESAVLPIEQIKQNKKKFFSKRKTKVILPQYLKTLGHDPVARIRLF